MSDASAPSSPPNAALSDTAATGAPLSLTSQQVLEALAAAREVLGGCRVERVLELSDKVTIAKVVLEAVLRGELAITRVTGPAAPKNAAPKPGHRPRLRRA